MINKEHVHIKLLNAGFVELIDYMGNDERIVETARVLKAGWRGEADEKLIHYMLTNGHTSPFEHVVFTFHIKCPIFVVRQWHRHRTWAYNEISARYKELPEEFFIPIPKVIGTQSEKNHQSRITEKNDPGSADETVIDITYACKEAFLVYHNMLERGVPREIARTVLPVGTYTEYYGTVNLHNLMHFLRLRLHGHAQREIQLYARALLEGMKAVVPFTTGVFTSTLDPEKYPLLDKPFAPAW